MSELYHAIQLPIDFSQEPPVQKPPKPDPGICSDCGQVKVVAWEKAKSCKLGGRWRIRCSHCKSQLYRERHPDIVKKRARHFREQHPHYKRERYARAKAKNPNYAQEQYAKRRRDEVAGTTIRSYTYKGRFGLTEEECIQMLESQSGFCAICGKAETARDKVTGKVRSLALDHDHATGKARAWLCHKCNHALGHADDDPERLRAMADYIEFHKRKA